MANAGRGIGGAVSGAAAGATAFGPIGGIVGGIGGLIGGLFSGDDTDVEALMEKAAAQFEGILPPDLAKAIVYTQYQQGGTLTPQQLASLPIEAQQVIKLQESPEVRQKQEVQLQALQELAQTGMGAQERFALEQSRLKSAQDAQARLKGLMQQYQQQGQGGGPAQLAAQLSALQGSSQEEMLGNMQAAAMAAENRRNAIQMAMQGASRLRDQDLAVNQSNVDAMRRRQEFDIQNSRQNQQINAQYAQQANMANLQRQQEVMDKNIAQTNAELHRRYAEAPQQMFQNQLALAQGKAGVYGQQAGIGQQQNQASAQNFSNIMGGVTGLAGAYAQNQQNQDFQNMWAADKGLVKDASGKWIKKTTT